MDALHAGQPHVFLKGDQQLRGSNTNPAPLDSRAVSAALRSLNDPGPVIRRVSAEILSQMSAPEVAQALIPTLNDEDPQVKIAA